MKPELCALLPFCIELFWYHTDVLYTFVERIKEEMNGFLYAFQKVELTVSNASNSSADENVSHLSIRRSLVT